ncbi:MAG: hypothetical protein R2695_10950 [Acidimicrobiales bacterium]
MAGSVHHDTVRAGHDGPIVALDSRRAFDRGRDPPTERPRGHPGERRLDHRSAVVAEQARPHHRSHEPGERVGHRIGHEHRLGLVDPSTARHRGVVAEPHPVRPPPGSAVGGDRQPRGTGGRHLRGHDAELVHHPRTRRLHHQVGRSDQRPQQAATLTIGQVDGDALLAVVEQVVERRGAAPRPVGATVALDLHHPGPRGAEQRGGERAGPQGGEIDHQRPFDDPTGTTAGQLARRPGRADGRTRARDGHPQQVAAFHELGGRPAPPRHRDRRPVARVHGPLDESRQRGDVVGPGQVHHDPAVGGGDEPRRTADRQRTPAAHSADRRPLPEQRGTVDLDRSPPSPGLVHEICGRRGHDRRHRRRRRRGGPARRARQPHRPARRPGPQIRGGVVHRGDGSGAGTGWPNGPPASHTEAPTRLEELWTWSN